MYYVVLLSDDSMFSILFQYCWPTFRPMPTMSERWQCYDALALSNIQYYVCIKIWTSDKNWMLFLEKGFGIPWVIQCYSVQLFLEFIAWVSFDWIRFFVQLNLLQRISQIYLYIPCIYLAKIQFFSRYCCCFCNLPVIVII